MRPTFGSRDVLTFVERKMIKKKKEVKNKKMMMMKMLPKHSH
jgi:hypothetical protein